VSNKNIICDMSFWYNSCNAPEHAGDKRYRITYKSLMGQERVGIITFRDVEAEMEFRDDLEIWMGEPLREVGPIIKISS